jgi:Plasmid pRiA4b ORF-3-like protein
VVDVGDRFTYLYDFGDEWEHDVVVEATTTLDPGAPPVRVGDGRRACPPEDCAGPSGSADLLSTLADPEHGQHRELMEWLGGPFDAEVLGLAATNALPRAFEVRWPARTGWRGLLRFSSGQGCRTSTSQATSPPLWTGSTAAIRAK